MDPIAQMRAAIRNNMSRNKSIYSLIQKQEKILRLQHVPPSWKKRINQKDEKQDTGSDSSQLLLSTYALRK